MASATARRSRSRCPPTFGPVAPGREKSRRADVENRLPAPTTRAWRSRYQYGGEREIYVTNFVASRPPEAREVGRLLPDHARATARRHGIRLLRLDCYAGGDGELFRCYERAGYTAVRDLTTVNAASEPWPGRLFEFRLAD